MMKTKFWLAAIFLCCFSHYLNAQETRFFPTHWWTGMKWNKVQVMIYHTGINNGTPTVELKYPGVTLQKVTPSESKNYLVLDILIAPHAKAGRVPIKIRVGKKTENLQWVLKNRRVKHQADLPRGINSQDLVYLIMPDRFANGDAANDVVKSYHDTICDRKNPSARHGGDILGVQQKLPYLKQLGVSAVWMCPVMENDMPWQQEAAGGISGYHGYWITDHYQVDKRFGGNEAYQSFVAEAHRQGLKVVQDAVYNHIGNEHLLFKDKPFEAMFNMWAKSTGSNHREEALVSAYTSKADRQVLLEGWFVPHLPDLNLTNPYMANFLIQNVLWCMEEFSIDGWRIDTYKYCDEAFLNKINNAIFTEYPTTSVFGEAWANSVPTSAYFTKNNMQVGFKHNLPGTTDFPLQSAMLGVLSQPYGWTEGLNRLMMTLSQDILYQDPRLNCTFLDNHDMDRFVSMIGKDLNKYKVGLGMLLTLRGIPQIYYGTEIFMANDPVVGDGKKRNDFPGGFEGDTSNKFEAAFRTPEETAAFNWVATLANFRKKSRALQTGTTLDFLPQNGIYCYFRKQGTETVMCLINQNSEETRLDNLSRFKEGIGMNTKATDVMAGKSILLNQPLILAPMSITILDLK